MYATICFQNQILTSLCILKKVRVPKTLFAQGLTKTSVVTDGRDLILNLKPVHGVPLIVNKRL